MRRGQSGWENKVFQLYKDKRVLITGHTGFKGGWLSLWLKTLGADVLGYSLPVDTEPSLYNVLGLSSQVDGVLGNILDRNLLEKTFEKFRPEIVFHLAAQPLVRLSYSEPVLTYETNVIGTLNVLEAARKCKSVRVFVNVTTDKCYENREVNRGYKEDEPMGGYDMYSSSKGCVEIMTSSYRRSFLGNGEFFLATARAGNVIGGGDWAQDRLLPDCARCISQGRKIEIRNPQSVRPWQHVLEPLSGYLTLGEKLYLCGQDFAQGFNFGPMEGSIVSVGEVVNMVVSRWGEGEIVLRKKDELHEANLLILNIEKAKNVLNWTPTYNVQEAIAKTVDWYKRFYSKEDMLDFTLQQIAEYEEKMNGKTASGVC